MRMRDVKGKRIVDVSQQRFWNKHCGEWAVNVDALILDDGTKSYCAHSRPTATLACQPSQWLPKELKATPRRADAFI